MSAMTSTSRPASIRDALYEAPGPKTLAKPLELTGVVSYINTRATGGILAFAVSAAGYALTAVVIAFVGNRIDRKVRIVR